MTTPVPTHHDVLVSTVTELQARTRSALTYCNLEASRTPSALFEALLDSLECLGAGLHVLEKMAAMSTEAGA